MPISRAVKSVLNMKGFKNNALMEILKVKSKQALSNKMSNERWSGKDLVAIAELTGGKLAFVYPDGQMVYLEDDEEKAPGADDT